MSNVKVNRFVRLQLATWGVFVVLALLTVLPIRFNPWPPEQPGDISSPGMVRLLNASLDREMDSMRRPPKASVEELEAGVPQLAPEAADNAQAFLGQIDQVVLLCRRMGVWGFRERSRRLEYEILLTNGKKLEVPEEPGSRCGSSPLLFRATFRDGRVEQVTTDGRERGMTVDRVREMFDDFGDTVLNVDRYSHRERYWRRPQPKKKPDTASQWE
ncbi:hypothetical protein ACLEPN_00675 [Myxococcus sp. 1LA]